MYVSYHEGIMERVYRAIHQIPSSIPGTAIQSPPAIVLALWATASDQIDWSGESDAALGYYEALDSRHELYQSMLGSAPNEYTNAWEAAYQSAVAFENMIHVAICVTLALAPVEDRPQMFWEAFMNRINEEFAHDREAFNTLADRSMMQAWASIPA